jgi:hypothetical protein
MNVTPRLRLVADASSEPLTLTDAKSFCRVDIADDDALITSLIASARRRVEKDTGLALKTQGWVAVFDRWPDQPAGGLSGPWWDGVRQAPLASVLGAAGVIEIPKRPFQAVTQIQLRDAYGALTTVDPSIYFVEVSGMRGRVIRKLGAIWPVVVLAPSSAIEIAFTAGFDAAPYTGISDDLVHAMRVLVKHWYDNRELVLDGRTSPVPHGYQDIVSAWRASRLK